MSLFSFNHLWITQVELCLKGTFIKASPMSVSMFLDIYETPTRKNFIDSSCTKHPKIMNWNKNWYKFLFYFVFLRHQKEVSKSKYVVSPPYSRLGHQELRLCLSNSGLMTCPFT